MGIVNLKRLLSILLIQFCLVIGANAAPNPLVQLQERDVKTTVEKMIQQKSSGLGWETRLKSLKIPEGIRVSAGRQEFEVIAPPRWEGWGKVSLGLIVRVNEKLEKNLTIHADVEAITEMVVTTRSLPAGHILEISDIALQKKEISSGSSRFVKNIDDVAGKKLRQSIKENSPIRVDLLEKVPVIKAGQMVTIVLESQTLRITVSGRAKGNGAVGDLIMVQNLTSMKDVPAVIVDANTVAIGF